MKATIPSHEAAKQLEHTQPTSPARPAPALHAIVEAICRDARQDSLKFVLRSDIGHDGE